MNTWFYVGQLFMIEDDAGLGLSVADAQKEGGEAIAVGDEVYIVEDGNVLMRTEVIEPMTSSIEASDGELTHAVIVRPVDFPEEAVGFDAAPLQDGWNDIDPDTSASFALVWQRANEA